MGKVKVINEQAELVGTAWSSELFPEPGIPSDTAPTASDLLDQDSAAYFGYWKADRTTFDPGSVVGGWVPQVCFLCYVGSEALHSWMQRCGLRYQP